MANPPKNTKSKKKEESAVGPRRRLLRSRSDRKIWGVAGGLAEHVGFDATLVRIAFVVTTFFGGAGLLAYLVLAVALPENDGEGEPVPESVWARLGKVVLVCFLVAIGIGVAMVLAVASAWSAATGHGAIVAAVVIALGAALVAAAFIEGIPRRVVPWFTVTALILAIPAGAIAAADIHIDESVGERTYTPTAVTDIPESGYELGTGQLVVDLRRLPWAKGQTIPVSASLGFGQMIVSVPSNVCIDGGADAKGGELIVGGEVSDGLGAEVDKGQPQSDAPRLEIDADIQFGQVVVTDEDPDDVDTHGDRYENNRHDEELDAQRVVCGR